MRKRFTPYLISCLSLLFLFSPVVQAADYMTINLNSDLSDVTSWEEIGNPGVNPIDFTNAGDNFYIFHDGTISSDWDVEGTVIVGDAFSQTPVVLTLPVGLNFVIRTAFIMEAGGEVVIQNPSNLLFNQTSPTTPSFTLNAGSTVTYNFTGAFTLPRQGYANLVINNSSTVTLAGVYVIEGAFTYNAPLSLNNGTTLTLRGDFTGTGSLTGNRASDGPRILAQGSGVIEIPTVDLKAFSTTNTTGVTLIGTLRLYDSLAMSGNINLNGNSITVGMSGVFGRLVYSSGFLTGSGSLTRFFTNSMSIPAGTTGRFPFGSSGNDRSFYLLGNVSASGTGSLTVSHSPATASSFSAFGTSYSDASITVDRRHNMSWTTSVNGLTPATTFSIRIQANGMPAGSVTVVSGLRVSLASGVAPGTSSNGTGSQSAPQANRAGLSAANLNNTFYVAGNSSINPLPVKLISFSAEDKTTTRFLEWSTASELNNDRFEVEKSYDGKEFLRIGTVKGAGNSNNTVHYQFTDEEERPQVSKLFYRLKQVDEDGSVHYSSVAVLQYATQGINILKTYPNPVADEFHIELNATETAAASVSIVDVQGKSLYESSFQLLKGYQQLSLPTTSLPSGVYFARISYGDKVTVERIVK